MNILLGKTAVELFFLANGMRPTKYVPVDFNEQIAEEKRDRERLIGNNSD